MVAGAVPYMIAALIGAAIPVSAFGRSLLLVLILPAVVLAFLTLGNNKRWRAVLSLATRPPAIALWVLFIVWGISVAGSIDFEKSLYVWSRSLLFVPLTIIVAARLSREPNLLSSVQRVLLVTAFSIQCLIVVFIHLEPVDGYPIDAPFLDILFPFKVGVIQANAVFKASASAAACLLPVALWSGWQLGRHWKLIAAALVPITFLVIWGDGAQPSRAALGGLVIGGVLVALAYGYSRATARIRVILVAIVVALCTSFTTIVLSILPEPPATKQEFEDMQSNVVAFHRQLIWKFTLDKAMERPIFGHGIDAINKVENAAEKIPFLNQEFIPSHPHNWIIEIFAETGAVGLLALIVAVLLLVRQLYGQAIAGRDPAAGWAAIALFGIFWGSSLANFSFWAAWWQASFWLLLAILLAANLQLNGAARPITWRI